MSGSGSVELTAQVVFTAKSGDLHLPSGHIVPLQSR